MIILVFPMCTSGRETNRDSYQSSSESTTCRRYTTTMSPPKIRVSKYRLRWSWTKSTFNKTLFFLGSFLTLTYIFILTHDEHEGDKLLHGVNYIHVHVCVLSKIFLKDSPKFPARRALCTEPWKFVYNFQNRQKHNECTSVVYNFWVISV